MTRPPPYRPPVGPSDAPRAGRRKTLYSRLSPPQLIALSFLIAILVGGILLSLPITHGLNEDGTRRPVNFLQALFTATSALCVTGLNVMDPAKDFNRLGQVIIMLLIQLGGLGIITFGTSFALLSRRRVNFSERMRVAQQVGALNTGGVLSLPPGGLGGDVPPEAGWWAVTLDKLKYLLLPLMILMLREIAVTMRFMRANMLETLTQDYVRTARAKGLADRRVLYKHALRNAVTPIVTIMGLSIPGLFGGAVITETVFSWPGMGKAILDALVTKDFNVVMVCLMMLAVLTVVFQLLTDLAYALVDPRIRYS